MKRHSEELRALDSLIEMIKEEMYLVYYNECTHCEANSKTLEEHRNKCALYENLKIRLLKTMEPVCIVETVIRGSTFHFFRYRVGSRCYHRPAPVEERVGRYDVKKGSFYDCFETVSSRFFLTMTEEEIEELIKKREAYHG